MDKPLSLHPYNSYIVNINGEYGYNLEDQLPGQEHYHLDVPGHLLGSVLVNLNHADHSNQHAFDYRLIYYHFYYSNLHTFSGIDIRVHLREFIIIYLCLIVLFKYFLLI